MHERGPLYVPEADRFHRSSRSDWFFAFLERYPSPHFVAAMGKDAFTADAWDVIGRKVAKERLLADIYETAKSSVGLPPFGRFASKIACRAAVRPRFRCNQNVPTDSW
jgi:hypothetical protein